LNRGYPGFSPAFARRKNPSKALLSRRNVACCDENDQTATSPRSERISLNCAD
jgi:hypothetical protein